MQEILEQVFETVRSMDILGLAGLIFGILAVVYLIKESILTWPFGILYVLVSFVVFYKSSLYGDFLLHIFYLILNAYGWYHWVYGKKKNEETLPVTHSSWKESIMFGLISAVGIFLFGLFLEKLPLFIDGLEPASLPYWDSSTSMLSITGMWLTARKKIDSWYYWFVVDILATGIYFYKDLYFYAFLYLIYIAMAIMGYYSWKKTYLGN